MLRTAKAKLRSFRNRRHLQFEPLENRLALAGPDLAVTDLTIDSFDGLRVSYTYTITNVGDETAELEVSNGGAPFVAGVSAVASSSPISGAGAILGAGGRQLSVETLLPGQSVTDSFSATPSGIDLDTYPWLILSVDPGNFIAESDEANNVASVRIDTGLPDLIVSDLSIESFDGTVLLYSYTMTNVGNGFANLAGPTSSNLDNVNFQSLLSPEPSYNVSGSEGVGGFRFGLNTPPVLMAGESFTQVRQVSKPAGIDTDAFPFLVVGINIGVGIPEVDDTNNVAVVQIVAGPTVVEATRDGGDLSRPDRVSSLRVAFSEPVMDVFESFGFLDLTAGGVQFESPSAVLSYATASNAFTASFFESDSFEPGFYEFQIDRNVVRSVETGAPLDGNGDGFTALPGDDDYQFPFYVAIPGDADQNGIVDVLSDAARLLLHLNQSSGVTWVDGDFNDDGVVDVLGDAAILVDNLGRDVRPTVASSAFVASTALELEDGRASNRLAPKSSWPVISRQPDVVKSEPLGLAGSDGLIDTVFGTIGW